MRLGKCTIRGTFSRTQRRLWSTLVRFGRYNLALALRSEFFTEFRIDSNSNLSIHNRKKSRIIAALMAATAKTTYAKILQKTRKQLWVERFDEVKSNATCSVIIAKHAHGKVWHFFLLFAFLNREIRHYFVGQSRKSWSAHCLAFLILFSDS